jgi:uncharacterized membrane protein YfcA
MSMWVDALVLGVSVVAGGLAAVTGFGIGSLLTPVLALQVDTRLAVAAVSVPHVVGTAVRFWLLSGSVDRRVFWSFRVDQRHWRFDGRDASRLGE